MIIWLKNQIKVRHRTFQRRLQGVEDAEARREQARERLHGVKQELAVRSGMFTGGVSEGSYRDNRQQRGIENQLKKKRDEANTGEEREDGASEGTAPKNKKAKKAKTKKESAAAPALPVFVPQNAWW